MTEKENKYIDAFCDSICFRTNKMCPMNNKECASLYNFKKKLKIK